MATSPIPQPKTVVLVAEGLRFQYRRQATPALDDVGLSLARGEIVGLLGPNGSGKSTLIQLMNGLRAPQAGSVRTVGGPVVAWVPQEYAFYPQLTCGENLRFFVSLLAVSAAERSVRLDHVVSACLLHEFLHKQARHCSGGVRRRLNIAIGLLQKPDLLLLDEPTVGVDPQTRLFLLDQVRHLAQQGAAIVYATHYMEEATAVCNTILILDHGRTMVRGDLPTLLQGTTTSGPFPNLEALFWHYTQRSLHA
jgi:ABC-2 type transport system ATP-binding protein